MENTSSRIGLLLGGRVRSVLFNGKGMEFPSTTDEVSEWFLQQTSIDEDRSLISYFYRCMEEGTEFYYLYEETTGWRCGGVTLDTPLRGKLVSLDEAQEAMEEWVEDLKYREYTVST